MPQPGTLAALPEAGLAALVLTTPNEVSLASHSQNTIFFFFKLQGKFFYI